MVNGSNHGSDHGSKLRVAWAGLPPARVEELFAVYGSAEAIVAAVARGAIEMHPAAAASMAVPAEELVARLSRIGVRFVEPERTFPDAPRWLFVKGKFSLPAAAVAVVGARRTSSYGAGIAREIGRRVAGAGWVVVSGLAKGIDGFAHKGALEVGGLTGAVLGCGIDLCYPARNAALGEEIIDSGGWVASEFPPGIRPDAWRFPTRNRIIAGLSRVVIVVEAAVRSGALITARLAAEGGKEVMAVPGDLDRPTSAGANLLIRDGAHPVTDLDSLVDELALWLGPPPAFNTVPGGGIPTPVDRFLAEMGLPAHEALAELSRLEAMGVVRVTDGLVMK